ncbi:class I SAM-dependent methyltransferase [Streptomyces sp. NPDC002133]|uniref:class I SAM-dependent methyltransferase n=1 Tax=Streptomyces sp. NPDC002133 TaxID=3154409 RepID=UPI00332A06EB
MSQPNLARHYDIKYAADATDEAPTPLSLDQPLPTDRFSAAVAELPRRLPKDADILELGAGNGLMAQSLLAGGVSIGSYTLGDLSAARMAGLRRNFTDSRFRFVQTDAEHPSATVQGPFDAVLMLALIEHLVDPLRAMIDIRSLLKPGGFVYLDTPNLAKWTRRAKLALGYFPSTASTNEGLTTYDGREVDLYDEGHLHYFTYRSLELMLTRRCGFSRVVRTGYYMGPRLIDARVGTRLARWRPTMFSEVACFAYA